MNKDLILIFAKRLEKFSTDEMIAISELEEKVVTEALDKLVEEKQLNLRGETYFYIYPKKPETNSRKECSEFPDISKMEGYDIYLKLKGKVKKRINKTLKLLELTHGLHGKKLKNFLNILYETNNELKMSIAMLYKNRKKFYDYGLKGILGKFQNMFEKDTDTNFSEVYELFKNFYLNTDKLSPDEAIKLVNEKISVQKGIKFNYLYSKTYLLRHLHKEFDKITIKCLRNAIPPKNKLNKIRKPIKNSDMLFFDAAKSYFRKLKMEKKLERLLNAKTSYDNHIANYFDNLTLEEIAEEKIYEFKHQKFNDGYSLASVKQYVLLIKEIIRNKTPDHPLFRKKENLSPQFDMNILSKYNIKKMLNLAKEKSEWGYAIIKTSLLTGANIPEILGLMWDCVDFDKKEIYIKQILFVDRIIKHRVGQRCRLLKLDNEIIDILKRTKEINKGNNNDLVFKITSDLALQRHFEEKFLKPIVRKLKFGKFSSTDIVHNFVNLMLEQAVPLTYIERRIGCTSTAKFLEIYKPLVLKMEKSDYNSLKNLKFKQTLKNA